MNSLPLAVMSALSDRYAIERELGQGGMATVYLATDVKHDRPVALKVLRPELGAVLGASRFLAEIKITARLDHPHILTLIDSGEVGGFLYYVLPFVRGESLRDLLNRDKQLGIEQALTITKQVASALDYAHRQGVVHRDIKPENILIQEGEAMLADFGIALAVKEAGGNRLTETGLSLGTPQYMSPEQATGDRQLDARSDVYSLAAVLYEMLTGEPPMTGPTVQAVIAKLLTEPPTRIRTVRSTVPEAIDAAVFQALAKVPADRFPTAGDFVRALSATNATAPHAAAARPGRGLKLGAIAGGVVVLAIAGALLAGRLGRKAAPVALRDRTQLTSTGQIIGPSLSPDGKQLAYFVKVCNAGPCTFAVDVQDVGATTTRRVLEGATAVYGMEWSPDRRNLLLYATVGGRWGGYLLSALGGPPRYLTGGATTFYSGGDSLLIGPAAPDSVFTVRVAGLNGTIHDSIRVPGPGTLSLLAEIPGTTRIVAMVVQSGRGLWQVLDRNGKVIDHVRNSCTCGGTASRDALWMQRAGPTAAEAVVRVAIDPETGRFA
ncbi:MAG TPA: serine/threonine-protein kinase, partial [Gemmatimonadales bacterium]|nr:serine/threonine-protein kinase [Gemmatimonadales bacterium]